MGTEKKEGSGTVSFRLSARHLEKLTVRANRASISHHQQAQAIIEAALDEREEETRLMRVELTDLRTEVEEMRAEVEAMRTGLMMVLSAVLTISRDEKMSLDAAKAFVKESFTVRKGGVKK